MASAAALQYAHLSGFCQSGAAPRGGVVHASLSPAEPVGSGPWPPGTLLHRLDPESRAVLLALGARRRAGPNTALLRQGEPGTHVVLLRQAFVKVIVPTVDGRQALLGLRISGDLVGEMAALNDRPRSATVVTCGEASYSVVRRAELRSFLARYPGAALELAGMVADRLRWANRRRVDFTAYPVKIRLARILSELAAAYGVRTEEGLEIGVELTQPELAALSGAAEPSVQRALRELRGEQLVSTGYRRVMVRDPTGLRTVGQLGPADDG
jgi:CRP/FNR family transcriptional regulator, cyclic AMP receptor protein